MWIVLEVEMVNLFVVDETTWIIHPIPLRTEVILKSVLLSTHHL